MAVYLMDPFLKDQSGHCYTYLHVLNEKIKLLGQETIFVGNELCRESINGTKIKGLFNKKIFNQKKYKLKNEITHQINKLININTKNYFDFGYDFLKIIESLRISKDDIVILNSLRPNHFEDLLKLIASNESDNLPRIKIILHFTSNIEGWTGYSFRRQYRNGFKLAIKNISSDRVVIFTDTDELVSEFQDLGASAISLAPVPVSVENNKYREFEQSKGRKKIIFSFIGEARREKGFRLLPQLCRIIHRESLKFDIEFNVQTGDLDRLTHKDFLIVEDLKKMNVNIIPNSLSIEDYNKLLNQTDVFLLPYVGPTYQRQSSGIFAEAMTLGKIAIVPRESWMGRQTNKLFGKEGDDLFFEQIYKSGRIRFINNIESLRLSNQKRKEKWEIEQNIDYFIKKLID